MRQRAERSRKMVNAAALHSRRSFAAIDFPLRISFMMLIIKPFCVIVACKVNFLHTALRTLPRNVVRSYCRRQFAERVMLFHKAYKLLRDFKPVSLMCVVNFIADAPHENAYMASVAPYPRSCVACSPFFEIVCIIIIGLVLFPHVEAFGID